VPLEQHDLGSRSTWTGQAHKVFSRERSRFRLWFFPSTPDALNCAPPSWPLLPNLEQTPFNSRWVVSPLVLEEVFQLYEALCQRQDVSHPAVPSKLHCLVAKSRTYLKPRYSGGRHSAEQAPTSNKPRGWKLVQPGRKIRWATNQAIGSNHSGTTILGSISSRWTRYFRSLGCPPQSLVVKPSGLWLWCFWSSRPRGSRGWGVHQHLARLCQVESWTVSNRVAKAASGSRLRCVSMSTARW